MEDPGRRAIVERKRKPVDRLVDSAVVEKKKPRTIAKGTGTTLKDIPYLAKKLRNNFDWVYVLHRTLIGGHVASKDYQRQVLNFSGIPDERSLHKVILALDGKTGTIRRIKTVDLRKLLDVLEVPRGPETFGGEEADREMLIGRLLEWLQKPVDMRKEKRAKMAGKSPPPKPKPSPKKSKSPAKKKKTAPAKKKSPLVAKKKSPASKPKAAKKKRQS